MIDEYIVILFKSVLQNLDEAILRGLCRPGLRLPLPADHLANSIDQNPDLGTLLDDLSCFVANCKNSEQDENIKLWIARLRMVNCDEDLLGALEQYLAQARVLVIDLECTPRGTAQDFGNAAFRELIESRYRYNYFPSDLFKRERLIRDRIFPNIAAAFLYVDAIPDDPGHKFVRIIKAIQDDGGGAKVKNYDRARRPPKIIIVGLKAEVLTALAARFPSLVASEMKSRICLLDATAEAGALSEQLVAFLDQPADSAPGVPSGPCDLAVVVGPGSQSDEKDFELLRQHLAKVRAVAMISGGWEIPGQVPTKNQADPVIQKLKSASDPWVIQHVGRAFEPRPGALLRYLTEYGRCVDPFPPEISELLDGLPSRETLWAPFEGAFPGTWSLAADDEMACRLSAWELAEAIKRRLAKPYVGLSRPNTLDPENQERHRFNHEKIQQIASAAEIDPPAAVDICLDDETSDAIYEKIAQAIVPGRINVFGEGVYNEAGLAIDSKARGIAGRLYKQLEKRFERNQGLLDLAKSSMFFVSFIPCLPGAKNDNIKKLQIPRPCPDWWIVKITEAERGQFVADEEGLRRVTSLAGEARQLIASNQVPR